MAPSPPAPPADLTRRALKGLAFSLVFMALFIFVPAWSLAYWQGWLVWLLSALALTCGSLDLLRRDPALVERRMAVGAGAEREPAQKRIQALNSLLLCGVFILSGLDRLLGWSSVPWPLTLAADAILALGYLVVFAALRSNSFASATVEIGEGQKVVTTGPYGLVRHPMYAGSLLIFLALPVGLGSWWGLVPALLFVPMLAWRLSDEEAFLIRNLDGYEDYRLKLRWRLIPTVW